MLEGSSLSECDSDNHRTPAKCEKSMEPRSVSRWESGFFKCDQVGENKPVRDQAVGLNHCTDCELLISFGNHAAIEQ